MPVEGEDAATQFATTVASSAGIIKVVLDAAGSTNKPAPDVQPSNAYPSRLPASMTICAPRLVLARAGGLGVAALHSESIGEGDDFDLAIFIQPVVAAM